MSSIGAVESLVALASKAAPGSRLRRAAARKATALDRVPLFMDLLKDWRLMPRAAAHRAALR